MTETSRPKVSGRLSRILCLLLAAYFLAIAGYALTSAKDYASAVPQFLRYVAAPVGIGLVLILCATRSSPGLRATVASTGLALLGGMFAFETFMTVRSYRVLVGMVALPEIGWMHERALDESLPPSRTAMGLNVALKVEQLPSALLGGIPNERVLLCTSKGTPVIYKADQFGYNNPSWVYDHSPDMLILGDSFVEGICLPPGADLVGQIRKHDAETINLGTRGIGPLTRLAMLGRFGPVLRPRTTILVFFEGNDWENLETELKAPYLRQALMPGSQFGAVNPPPAIIEGAKRVIAQWQSTASPDALMILSRTSMLRNFLALHNSSLALGIAYPKVAPEIPEYSRILGRAKQITAGWGGDLALMYIPRKDRYMGLINRDFVYDQVRRKVLAAAAENHVPVIDLVELFARERTPLAFYAPDFHFSESGAAFGANAILAKYNGTANNRAIARNGDRRSTRFRRPEQNLARHQSAIGSDIQLR